MGLDLFVYKLNRRVDNSKDLKAYRSADDPILQSGLKRNNMKLIVHGLFTNKAIESYYKSFLVERANRFLNYSKARKLDLIGAQTKEVFYSRKWEEFRSFCDSFYDEKKEGCSFNFYGVLILSQEIIDKIRTVNFKDSYYKSRLLTVIANTDFDKETLYVCYWG